MAQETVARIKESIAGVIDSVTHQNAAGIAKKIGADLGLDQRFLDYTHLELRNKLSESRFRKVPYKDRMLALPHCMRKASACIAKFGENGLDLSACPKCKAKNECKIPALEKEAKALGYQSVVCVPGGSMVAKLIQKNKPKAIIGVACASELNEGLDRLQGVMPTQTVMLLRDGCHETDVSIDEAVEKMRKIETPASHE